MMDIAKFETLKKFTTLNKTLLFLIQLNKAAAQSAPKVYWFFQKNSVID